MIGHVKSSEGNDNNYCLFNIDNDKHIKNYKTIWTKIEYFKNIELNVLPIYDNRHIKAKTRTSGDKIYTNFCGLNVSKDGVE